MKPDEQPASGGDGRNVRPGALPREGLERMRAAGEEIRKCYRVLDKAGLNIVGEILRGQGTFYENEHYPADDVFDGETHSQYYYHAHRGPMAEHGHFHTFLRAAGMPAPSPGRRVPAPCPIRSATCSRTASWRSPAGCPSRSKRRSTPCAVPWRRPAPDPPQP